jgi:hypothetical protein
MALNMWAAYYGNKQDAVVAGDVAMLAPEVTPCSNTAEQRHRCRRDSSPHQGTDPSRYTSCTIGAGSGAEAGDWCEGDRGSTRHVAADDASLEGEPFARQGFQA